MKYWIRFLPQQGENKWDYWSVSSGDDENMKINLVYETTNIFKELQFKVMLEADSFPNAYLKGYKTITNFIERKKG